MGHVEVTLIFLCVVVQLLSLAHQASLSFIIEGLHLLKFAQTHVH